ncbi:erythropoietin receptor [Microcaecilia unicolor]|uniref:Erythropoietin receptor n=1 Tax=Microcaecilia unicolor TaxID=1415580 RepID=A0A6P7XQ92_9AMPH|nr:erythropoietin receptor [Microcaecilia unicolor]
MEQLAVGVLFLILARTQAYGEQLPEDFYSKVSLLLAEELENPKCFTRTLEDLTCFWEDGAGEANRTFSFYYQLENDPEKSCRLSSKPTAQNSTWYICSLPIVDVVSFAVLRVRVTEENSNTPLYRRSLQINDVVLLDSPRNLTVSETEHPGQLFISWEAPQIYYLEDSFQYEVSFSSAGHTSIIQDGILSGRTDYTVTNVKEQMEYTIAVRVKPDGVSFSGYWSAWSQPVSVVTSSRELDPLILTLILILALLLLLIGTLVLLSHRRFLKQKVWPVIPNPANHFEGLFDMHKGNFQQWLGHSNTYLWWIPRLYTAEDMVTSVEILSELGQVQFRLPAWEEISFYVPSFQSTTEVWRDANPGQDQPPLALKDSYVALDERIPSFSVALNNMMPEEEASEDQVGQQMPGPTLEVCTGGQKEESGELDSALTSSSPTNGTPSPSPEQTSSSSFEYTVLDPMADTLSPRVPRPALQYSYLPVSDSGIATDYSTMSSNPSLGKPQRGQYSNFYENTPNYVICSQC